MKRNNRELKFLIQTILLILSIFCVAFVVYSRTEKIKGKTEAKQPNQPKSGPGGANYNHKNFSMYHYREGNEEYWLFEPASPLPKTAPVIVFLHGWGGMEPRIYGAWIEHLVRRGNIVIYPRYQSNLRTRPSSMTPAAIGAVKDAFENLKQEGHVKPKKGFFAAVGHSLGGVIAANIAARAKKEKLPGVNAIMALEPGDSKNPATEKAKRIKVEGILDDYSTIPSNTLLLTVIGADDRVAGDETAVKIFNGAKSVPIKNKAFITIYSDNHGTPPLVANHFFPVAPVDIATTEEEEIKGPVRKKIKEQIKKRIESRKEQGETDDRFKVDALDYHGSWRLFDALTDCAFYKKNCDYALNDTQKMRFMGRWGDGAPVKELSVTDKTKAKKSSQ